MTELRVRAHWATQIFPFDPIDWFTRAAVYDVTCGNCRQPFVGRLHFVLGLRRHQLPRGYGVRCPHCRAFNELA